MCLRGVHDWMEWCVRADHMDVGVRRRCAHLWAYVCVWRVQRCVEKVMPQVPGLCLCGCIWGCVSAKWARASGGSHHSCP